MKRGIAFLASFLLCIFVSGQDQKIADSLLYIYEHKPPIADSVKQQLFHDISFHHNDVDKKLFFAEKLIELGSTSTNSSLLYSGNFLKGSALRLKGDLEEALGAYLLSIKYAQELKNLENIGEGFLAIGDVYSVNGNHKNSVYYYNRAIEILRNQSDSVTLATALLNAGDEYFNANELDTALRYFQESGQIFDLKKSAVGKAYNLGNVGLVYAKLGDNSLAESNITKSIEAFEKLGNLYPVSVYLTYMSDIYLQKGDDQMALSYASRSLALAKQYQLKDQISAANLKISKLYEEFGDYRKSFSYYKEHISYRDSVNNIKSVQQMADLRTDFEVSQKQTEVDLLNQQKKNQQIILAAAVISSILIFLLAIGLYRRYNFIKETNIIIEEEKNRSENLLLNILPEETARELKQSGSVQAKKFESVTVLFSDFKGFTTLAERVEPEQLVKSIDFYFKEFDKITTKYGLEKIKTIGDAYMCAGGLPTISKTHAKNVIRAAKEMIELINSSLKNQDDLIHFEIRIGVHTGPVVAGIVGLKKWQYDIWGDTVNIASRMESMSESGMINVSETTFQEIKDEFSCEYRGNIDVKNRGALKMYFLS